MEGYHELLAVVGGCVMIVETRLKVTRFSADSYLITSLSFIDQDLRYSHFGI